MTTKNTSAPSKFDRQRVCMNNGNVVHKTVKEILFSIIGVNPNEKYPLLLKSCELIQLVPYIIDGQHLYNQETFHRVK